LGLLTEMDQQTLAMYCECWGRYLRSQEVLAREGDTYMKPSGEPKQRPEYYIMKDSLKEAEAIYKPVRFVTYSQDADALTRRTRRGLRT